MSSRIRCFHCMEGGLIWDNDFNFSDFGYEGEGIVHILHCPNCGADVEYRISLEDIEVNDDEK